MRMAWNEPGGNNNKDPWGREKQSPPDLDDVLNKLLAGSKDLDQKKAPHLEATVVVKKVYHLY